jgi:hypothetical protein
MRFYFKKVFFTIFEMIRLLLFYNVFIFGVDVRRYFEIIYINIEIQYVNYR